MKFSAPENNFQNSFRDDVAPTENIQNRQNSTKSKGGSTQKWWNESPFGGKCGVNSWFLAFFRLLTKCGANSKKSLKFRLILKKMKFSAPENNFQNSFKNDVAPTEKVDEKQNSRSAAPYRRFGAFISKVETRNFCQLGKNVFFVLPIFSKNRGNRGLFLRVRPQFFFINLYKPTGFPV